MPLYVYEDPKTKMRVEERRPVEERDRPCFHQGRVLVRVTAPERLGILNAVQNPWTMEAQMRKGLRYHEERGNLKGSAFTKTQLKQTWGRHE